ncbi:MAG: hypothetical protein SFY32_17620 [Bacteroidota bacterium]|nr:hypothetical protein [Bacteroidota bacterium]
MDALLIKSDSITNKLLLSLAKKLGASVQVVNEIQYEDFILGSTMDKVKTGILVSKSDVLKKLKK